MAKKPAKKSMPMPKGKPGKMAPSGSELKMGKFGDGKVSDKGRK